MASVTSSLSAVFCSRPNSLKFCLTPTCLFSGQKRGVPDNCEVRLSWPRSSRFRPRVGWCCVGAESGSVFNDIDLNEKEWAEYDEKANQPVEINEMSSRFIVSKK
uniref:Uncharacterized protein n=1 Tax=Ditylenchus dipsaci TaxID=166011 RepID=A0A915EB14_9BILA